MNRRHLIAGSLTAGVANVTNAQTPRKFKLKYAPHFGMFRNHAPGGVLDELKFMADQGFTALEDNGLRSRPKELQEQIDAELQRLGMTMGVFVATADFNNTTFVVKDQAVRDKVLADLRDSVEVAKRVGAKWCTVVLGRYHVGLEWDYQTANAIDLLKRCCDLCEPTGLVMVMEPLNAWRDHPGLFLTRIPQAYMLCKAVRHPSCKILFDMYHQQITEGNIIPNIDRAWDEVPYFQIGDNPGRKEPGTGEMNYRNIFKHIHGKGFTGVMGMEHGNSRPGKEGEQAVIDAYATADGF